MFSLRSLKLASSLLPRHSTRLAAASFSSSKKPLHFELPDALANIGSKVFDFNTLEPATLRAYKRAVTEGTPLEDKYKDKLAQAIQNWALSKGAVNCSHWFSALRGTNAEKVWLHRSLVTYQSIRHPLVLLTVSQVDSMLSRLVTSTTP